MLEWVERIHLDAALSALVVLVALYYRTPLDKREEFEKNNPRFASFMGLLAAVLPFVPAIISSFKGIIHGTTPDNSIGSGPHKQAGTQAPRHDDIEPNSYQRDTTEP